MSVHSLAQLFGHVGEHGEHGTVMQIPDSSITSLLVEHGVWNGELLPIEIR